MAGILGRLSSPELPLTFSGFFRSQSGASHSRWPRHALKPPRSLASVVIVAVHSVSLLLLSSLLLASVAATSHHPTANSHDVCPSGLHASTCAAAPVPPSSASLRRADGASAVPPHVSSPTSSAASSPRIPPESPPLRLPVLWMAPFLSAGGYSSEAVAFATSLAASPQSPPLKIKQHGDGTNWEFISGLPDSTVRTLQELFEGTTGAAGRGKAEEGAGGEEEMEYGREEDGMGEWERLWRAGRGRRAGRTEEEGGETPGGSGSEAGAAEEQDSSSSSSSNSRGSVVHGVVICHSEPGAWEPPLFQTLPCPPASLQASAFLVGRTMFETDRVTPTHVQRCNRMHQIWVPSAFHLHSFAASGVEPSKLRVLPQPVDVRAFHPAAVAPALRPALPPAELVLGPDRLAHARDGDGEMGNHGKDEEEGMDDESDAGRSGSGNGGQGDWCGEGGGMIEDGGMQDDGLSVPGGEGGGSGTQPFVFLSMFKWEQRKGWDVLLRAYLSTFTASDPVLLYLVTNAYHTDSHFAAKIASFLHSANITEPPEGWPSLYVRAEHVAQSDLPNVFRAADFFVLPTRGEGWGRPIVEAMASGLPVIATNWSGITEYLNVENGYPLPVDHLSEVPDGPFKGHLWAEPSVSELCKLMRGVLSDRAGDRRSSFRMQSIGRYLSFSAKAKDGEGAEGGEEQSDVSPPRAVADDGDNSGSDAGEGGEAAPDASEKDQDGGSIRAPLSVEGETEEEHDSDDDDNESFGSANERAEGSVGSFGTSPVAEDFMIPKAKVTGDSEDFSVPVVSAEMDADGEADVFEEGEEEVSSAVVTETVTESVVETVTETAAVEQVTATVTEAVVTEVASETVVEQVEMQGSAAAASSSEVVAAAADVSESVATVATTETAAATETVTTTTTTVTTTTVTSTTSVEAETETVTETASATVEETVTAVAATAGEAEAQTSAVVDAGEAAQVEGDLQARLQQAIADASRVDVEDVDDDDSDDSEAEEWVDGEEDDEDEDDEEGAGVSASLDALVRDMEAVVQGAAGGSAAGGINLPPRMSAPRGLNGSLDLPARPQSSTRSADSGSEGSAVDSVARQAAAVIARQGMTGAMGDPAAAGAAPDAPLNPRAEKVNSVRVKLLRLAARLGQSHSNVVVAQVLYRLELAEKFQETSSRAGSGGVRIIGGAMGSAMRLDRARERAAELDATEGADSDLDFGLTIMVVGKTGVGKTATIHSLLGTTPPADAPPAELPATTRVREVTGRVHGVNVKVVDVPGLHPSVADMRRNQKILRSAKRYLRGKQPDIVLYVDRLDVQARDYGDMELVRPISDTFGPAVWMNTIVVLTHASSAPPEDSSGRPMSYEMYVAQRSHVVQQTIRQASGDMRLLNPVALAENHPACRTNRTGDRVLPNGQVWRPQLLLLCFASKCLSEANSVLEIGGPASARAQRGRSRMPPLPYLLSSLLGPRQPLRLPEEQQMGDDDEYDESSDSEGEDDEVDFDALPPFRRLTKAELQQLEPAQRREYYEELADRERLFQKKQWREELRRRRELRRKLEAGEDVEEEGAEKAKGAEGEEGAEEDAGPSNVPVPMPDLDLPPSFDSDQPSHRYRYIETANQWLVRPMLEQHGWDHDTGYDGFQMEKAFAIRDKIPASVSGQITKDKKDCTVALEAAASMRHGTSFLHAPVTTAGLDVQSVGSSLAYTLRSETRFRTFPHNRTTAGISFTTYDGSGLTTGLKVEDRLLVGKSVSLNAAAGFVRCGRLMARGANCEVQVRHPDHPLDRTMGVLGLTLMDWQGDLVVGANVQAQATAGKTNLLFRANVNNRAAGTISLRATSNEQLQMALIGLVPLLRYFLAGGFLFGNKGDEMVDEA
ncbi:unnamed protein product [Closterium sp. NIES-64]|nr:unnamed protein product [Closterium sp. NIES-64]